MSVWIGGDIDMLSWLSTEAGVAFSTHAAQETKSTSLTNAPYCARKARNAKILFIFHPNLLFGGIYVLCKTASYLRALLQ